MQGLSTSLGARPLGEPQGGWWGKGGVAAPFPRHSASRDMGPTLAPWHSVWVPAWRGGKQALSGTMAEAEQDASVHTPLCMPRAPSPTLLCESPVSAPQQNLLASPLLAPPPVCSSPSTTTHSPHWEVSLGHQLPWNTLSLNLPAILTLFPMSLRCTGGGASKAPRFTTYPLGVTGATCYQ